MAASFLTQKGAAWNPGRFMQDRGRRARKRNPTALGCESSAGKKNVVAEGVAGFYDVGRCVDPPAQPDNRAIPYGDCQAAVGLAAVKRLRSAEDSAAGINNLPEVLHAPTVRP
jgi:hypothetical protein